MGIEWSQRKMFRVWQDVARLMLRRCCSGHVRVVASALSEWMRSRDLLLQKVVECEHMKDKLADLEKLLIETRVENASLNYAILLSKKKTT